MSRKTTVTEADVITYCSNDDMTKTLLHICILTSVSPFQPLTLFVHRLSWTLVLGS